ncbi:MAG: arginyltransferase [Lysobacteraceae bacterium]|nr:MAG: arginyltransferase [Xanthomonadaceae bacterium]
MSGGTSDDTHDPGADRTADAEGDLRLLHTADHACGYWPDRLARDLVFDPSDPRLAQVYPMALTWGFRRSGNLIYRPHCRDCKACTAVRIPVDDFDPDRSQRRCLARNADIEARVLPAERNEEHFALYQRYLTARHPGGGMDTHGVAEFDQFLISAWGHGRFLELRQRLPQGRSELLAVAVTDVLPHGLSAIYTFYDPDVAARGLGTYAILQQIAWARREGRRYLYLGYWIDGHRKMDYKRRFSPLEMFDGREWHRIPERG